MDRVGLRLAWHLAARGAHASWIEWGAGQDPTRSFLDPAALRQWRRDQLPTVAAPPPSSETWRHPQQNRLAIIPGWREIPDDTGDAAERLGTWLHAHPPAHWAVIRASTRRWTLNLQVPCDLLIVVCEARGDSLRALRAGLPRGVPARYVVLTEPLLEDRAPHLFMRLPGAFREGCGLPHAGRCGPPGEDDLCIGEVPRPSQWQGGTPFGASKRPSAAQTAQAWHRLVDRLSARLDTPVPPAPALPSPPPPLLDVPRFCLPADATPQLDGPFLADPVQVWWAPRPQEIQSALDGCSLALVVGPPGIGKSEVAKALGRQPGRQYRGLTDGPDVFDLVTRCRAPVLVLDGVDELPDGGQGFAQDVAEALRQREAHGLADLALWIFGRDTPWTHAVGGALKPRKPALLSLQPLRRDDFEVVASAHSRRPTVGLLDAALNRRVGALAALPLGARLLGQLWSDDADLPSSRLEVYRKGLEALISHRDASAADVLPIARPIAWAAIAGTKLTLHRGHRSNALDLNEVEAEFTGLSGAAVRTALRSPLFTPTGDTWRFTHLSFGEFLAAECLRQQRLLLSRLKRLLLKDDRVPTPLLGLAGWLASMDPRIAELLIEHEPASLVRSGAFLPGDQHLEMLVGLAQEARSGRYIPRPEDLAAIDAPAAIEEARESLVTDAHAAVRALGVMVTAAGDPTEAAARLADIAANHHLKDDACDTAARLLLWTRWRRAVAESDLDRLRARLLRNRGDATEASLLWLLWPNHVPAADALTALLAGDLESSDRLYFAEREGPGLVEALAPDEVRQALDFICEGRLSTYQRSPLRDALLQRAWDLADEPSMAKALGAALASEAQRHALHRADIDLGGAPAAQVEAVAVAAIEAAQRPVDVELGDLGLVPTVEAVVEHAERACQTPGEHALASRWMHWLEYYWRLPAELHPRIRTVAQTLGITDKWDVRLNPPPPKPMPRRQRPPEPPWHVRFRADLAEVASWDNPFGAWRALAGRYRPHDLDPDELTGSDAQQVRKLALSFLASWSAVTPAWLGDWLFRSAVSTALRWHDAPPALGVAPIWVAALVAEHAPSDAPEPVRAVVQASTQPLAASVELLLVHAPSTVATALSWLDRPLDGALRDRALGLLAQPADPEQGQGTGPQLPAVSRAHLLRVLLDLDDQAQAWTWSLTPLHDGDFWMAAPLFAHDPQGAWEAVDAQLRADEEWARDLLRAVADTHEAWVSLSWRGPEQLQWVIARVTALFGEQLQPAHGRVTAENRLYERRRILLDALFDGGHDEHLAALAKDCALPPSYIERARQNRPHRGLSIAEAARFERRLLTPGELLERVLEALEDLQREMWDRHSPWRAFFDWNHAKGSKEVWRKQEVHACVLLVNLLQPHLRGALPTVVLEPQEQGSEDRIDIYFEAHAEASKRRLTLKVEVKWDNYNPVKGVTEQLRDYLKDSPDVAGLLLVLDPPDGDFQLQSGGRTPVDEQALQRACDALSADLGGRPVQPFILRLGRQRSRPRGKK